MNETADASTELRFRRYGSYGGGSESAAGSLCTCMNLLAKPSNGCSRVLMSKYDSNRIVRTD